MFQQVDLKCFRQHESLSLTFQQGVIALRGRNEAGKTTILEAIAYALFGATALREPLEDTVTWGRKAADLKVKVDFHLNGVDYRVTRGKSGAEIRTAETILAAGQKEVTKYVETLLGASADVCSRLMLASQDDIKGALSKGPSAAIELIEKLSNLSVIDTIIGLVQDKLPCGATTAVDARITTLDQQLAVPVQDDTGPLVETLADRKLVLDAAQADYETARASYDSLQTAANTAQEAVDEHARLVKAEARDAQALQTAKATLASLVIPACPTESDIAGLRKRAEDAGYMKRAEKAAEVLSALVEPENRWEGTHDELVKDRDTARASQKAENDAAQALKVKIAQTQAQAITQTACGLCGKDLSKVPEVVTKNADIERRVAEMTAQMKEHVAQAVVHGDYADACDELITLDRTFQQAFQKAGEFAKVLPGHVPPYFEWAGPAEFTDDAGNPASDLATAEAQVKAHSTAVGRRQQLETSVADALVAWEAAATALAAAEAGLPEHQQTLNEAADRLVTLNAAQAVLRQAQAAYQEAAQALQQAQAVLRVRQEARAALEADMRKAREELTEMQDNNALIKFLRECRPAITDQLWSIVMSAVSQYFSDIRGVPSTVQRADNGFKVDGHNVAGLSGSTKDALGLAIRMALTKTFLPNAAFMVLDEPAAAADDERENNMLGVVATSGFEQVLFVSHSPMIDSFASQVVQL